MKKTKQYRPLKSGISKFVKKRLYDTINWVEYRVKFIYSNPKCYSCGAPSRVVDHVVPHKNDEIKFWDFTNLLPLCKSCHDFCTASFDRFVVPKTEEKMKWISNKRLETETLIRVKLLPVPLKD